MMDDLFERMAAHVQTCTKCTDISFCDEAAYMMEVKSAITIPLFEFEEEKDSPNEPTNL